MPPNPTDFYLNLDRWENLSAVERERGAWRARFEGPASRVDPIRQEASFQAAWSLHLPDRSPDARSREKVLGPIPPEGKLPALLWAWRYCRAVRFVEGWYQAFPWTTAGVEQVARLLMGPTERLEEGISTRLVTSYHEASRLAEDIGRIPVFQAAAFYGGFEYEHGVNDIYWQLHILSLRLLLLQGGYFQVLAAPIEPHIRERLGVPKGGVRGAVRTALPPSPENLLGTWLDGVTDLLLDVGKRADESWARSKSFEARTSLQETILTLALQHGRVSAGDILRATGANRNTVKDNLARLVQEGTLQKHGQKRGTIYLPA
jgi:hypothetical protein